MRLLSRRRSPTPAEKVADTALKVTRAATKVLVAQRVARKGVRRYKLTKRIVPLAVLGAVGLVVWRKVGGGGGNGGGGGGSSTPTPTGPTGPTTSATPPAGPSSTPTPTTGAPLAGVTDGPPPASAEVVAAASVVSDADDVPSPAATAGTGPGAAGIDPLAAQAASAPTITAKGGGVGESSRGDGEPSTDDTPGEGQTPTEPDLDIDGPNESAPGSHPTPSEQQA